jgi:membrane-bound serine protease (ClpP class)
MKLVLSFLFFILGSVVAQANCTLSIEFRDAIGPATYDYLEQAQTEAQTLGCTSILVRINTPGGSLQSTRKIVELMMGSPIPFLCLVHPSGGHAGSAGAIIMQACHVNGMVEATNIGAASPVAGGGQEIPEDLRKKLFEDTRSWVEGLAKYRGRSADFAKEIVMDAKALDAQEAFEYKAIDVVASGIDEFLQFADGRPVRLNQDATTPVVVGDVVLYPPGLRHDVMQVLSNPQWAYLIFMGSLGLLYYELTNPGTILPGVVGAMGLVVSMMNFHMLDVSWGGVLLILLGVGFMIAEIFVPSFGALGLGGLASFVIGSIFLFDEKSGYQVPIALIFSTSIILFMLMTGVAYFAVNSLKRGRENRQKEKLEGQVLTVKNYDNQKKQGMGFLHGELWKIQCQQPLSAGDMAKIEKVKGFKLIVSKVDESQ